MTHQPTHHAPAAQPRTPEPWPTSALEVQLEGRLVARCGVDAMLRRPAHDRPTRVDWVLLNLDDPAEQLREKVKSRLR